MSPDASPDVAADDWELHERFGGDVEGGTGGPDWSEPLGSRLGAPAASEPATGQPTRRWAAHLTDEQRKAVDSPAAPLLVLAGPGSGKTRVLTQRLGRRIDDGSADPRRTMVATFTRRAAVELRQRLRAMGLRTMPWVGTFHALALRQLWHYDDYAGRKRRALVGDRRELVTDVVTEQRHRAQGGGPMRAGAQAMGNQQWTAALATREIDWASARGLTPQSYRDCTEGHQSGKHSGEGHVLDNATAAWVARVWEQCEAQKRRRGLVDYDDVLRECCELLETDQQFRRTQRWFFQHFFVDEFQDLNAQQFNLLRAWLGERTDLFAVGDPNQAIFGWNGADDTFTTGFLNHFPTGQVLTLGANHRSSEMIQAATDALLGRPTVPDPREPRGAAVTISEFPSSDAEAVGVAQLLRDQMAHLAAGGTWAVLARTNRAVDRLEQALGAAQVPCRRLMSSAWRNQPDARAILEALANCGHQFGAALDWVTLLLRDAAEAAEVASAEEPQSGAEPDWSIGGPTQGQSSNGPIQIHEALKRYLARAHDGPGQQRDRPAAREEQLLAPSAPARRVLELATEFAQANRNPTGEAFANWYRSLNAREASSVLYRPAPVELATFHAAKGLEWPCVVVTGLSDLADEGPASEERRVAYVALSRAERELHLTHAGNPPSWLAAVAAATRRERARPESVEQHLRAARERLAARQAGDAATLS